MPHYVDDPENHGKKIDVIELWKRNPDKPLPPDPRIIDRLLKRDTWTAREAILTLAGYDPDNTDWQDNGQTLVDIPYGRMTYLDGTMAHQLMIDGWLRVHPLQRDCLSNVYTLQSYLINEPLTLKKTPADWLTWAQSKGHLLPESLCRLRDIEPALPQVELVADAETTGAVNGITAELLGKTDVDTSAKQKLAEFIALPDISGMPPELWAHWLAWEFCFANEQPGHWVGLSHAEIQYMRAFEAHRGSLPLRQYPTCILWPKNLELPPQWATGLVMLKGELRTWAAENCPDMIGRLLGKQADVETIGADKTTPWMTPNDADPQPIQLWYTPARYFARELVRGDTSLLGKRDMLCKRIVERFNQAGIKKRGNVKQFDPSTIKKALVGIAFG